MPTGRVKWYDADKGFGFLAQDGGEMECDREIRRQWARSLIAGVLLVVSFVFSVSLLFRHRED